jgi:Ca-activated chloride channel family protein
MMDWQSISAFSFEWPWMLLLLLLVPLFWQLYLTKLRQKWQTLALNFSYTAVVDQMNAQPAIWKRLFYPIMVSLLLCFLIIGLARPTVTARVPVNSADIMLVLDISLSMLAEDIKPDRMNAAKQAAIDFVRSLPKDARVGLEFFAGDNYVASPPISRHDEIIAYLQALKKEDLKPRTEIGSALKTATQILDRQAESSTPEKNAKGTPSKTQKPAARKPDRVIILLSDGDSHEGFPWDLAAKQARQENITVHTIGVGSPEGGFITYQGVELPVTFDENTLRQTAALGGGNYFRVFRKADFKRVYNQIHERTIHYEQRNIELSFLMAGAGLLTLLGGILVAIFCL